MIFDLLGYKIKIRKVHKPNSLGVLSLCTDGNHVVLLDFDIPKDVFKVDYLRKYLFPILKELQEDYDLGDFEIYETAGGFHAVCFTKVTYKEYLLIMDDTELLDPGFSIQARLRKEKATTLRFYSLNKDKYSKYITTLKTEYGYKMPYSEEHKQMFNHLKGKPVINTGKGLQLVWYYHNKTKH